MTTSISNEASEKSQNGQMKKSEFRADIQLSKQRKEREACSTDRRTKHNLD